MGEVCLSATRGPIDKEWIWLAANYLGRISMQLRFVRTFGIFLLVIVLAGCGISARGGSMQTGTSGTMSLVRAHPQTPMPDFGRFVNRWFAHSAVLIFSPNGSIFFEKRVYRWCGPGVPPPCDTIDADGRIWPGYQEDAQFSRVTGSMAYGTITASNLHSNGLAVTVTLQAADTLLYTANGKQDSILLCGPAAPPGECGA
jgi:hypothetical protein